jgi:hypothetical protein
MDMDE